MFPNAPSIPITVVCWTPTVSGDLGGEGGGGRESVCVRGWMLRTDDVCALVDS